MRIIDRPRSVLRTGELASCSLRHLVGCLISSDDNERNVRDNVEHNYDELENAEKNVDCNREGVFGNWNPAVMYSENPNSSISYQQGRENQQPSIDDGAPLEECPKEIDIHIHAPFLSC